MFCVILSCFLITNSPLFPLAHSLYLCRPVLSFRDGPVGRSLLSVLHSCLELVSSSSRSHSSFPSSAMWWWAVLCCVLLMAALALFLSTRQRYKVFSEKSLRPPGPLVTDSKQRDERLKKGKTTKCLSGKIVYHHFLNFLSFQKLCLPLDRQKHSQLTQSAEHLKPY